MSWVQHTIGTTTVPTGYEWNPLAGGASLVKVFMAEDGRALCVYSRPDIPSIGHVTFEWRQTNGIDLDSWGSAQTIQDVNVGTTDINAFGITGWMDASDNIYVAYFGRDQSAEARCVKLTKSGGGGWSLGTVRLVDGTNLLDAISVVKVPTSGRIWVFGTTAAGGLYRSYYNDNDLAGDFTAGPTFGNSIDGSGSPIFAVAWGNQVLMVRKTTTPKIVATRRTDSDSPSTWDGDTDLWTGAAVNAGDTWHHVLSMRYLGHANGTATVIFRRSDAPNNLVLKEYLDGTGWGSEVTIGVSGGAGIGNAIWAGGTIQKLLVNYDGASAPKWFNPDDNSVTVSGFTFNLSGWGWSGKTANLILCGGESAGSGGTSTLYLWTEIAFPGTPLSRKYAMPLEIKGGIFSPKRSMPVEMLGGVSRKYLLPVAFYLEAGLTRKFPMPVEFNLIARSPKIPMPVEWAGATVLQRNFPMSIEWQAALARKWAMPVEWLTGLLRRDFRMEIEFGGGVGRAFILPVESTGANILLRKFPIPVEIAAILIRTYKMEVEWSGEGLSLVDSWNVLQKLSDPFMDEWRVVATALDDQSFQDSWNVKVLLGAQFPDSWRVLPQEIVTLFNSDIQLPKATVDKT